MASYRKKPVVIEAFQWTGDNADEVGQWIRSLGGSTARLRFNLPTRQIVIPTLEGDHAASPGDWIICGIQGELYPCKPDIFAAAYELVPTPATGGKDHE